MEVLVVQLKAVVLESFNFVQGLKTACDET
jgi:hypothetical protein